MKYKNIDTTITCRPKDFDMERSYFCKKTQMKKSEVFWGVKGGPLSSIILKTEILHQWPPHLPQYESPMSLMSISPQMKVFQSVLIEKEDMEVFSQMHERALSTAFECKFAWHCIEMPFDRYNDGKMGLLGSNFFFEGVAPHWKWTAKRRKSWMAKHRNKEKKECENTKIHTLPRIYCFLTL